MAREECGGIRVGFIVLLEGTNKSVLGSRRLLLSCSPEPPGVKQAPNHPRVENGNMETACHPPVTMQAIRGDRGRTEAGRSPHSSLRTGKPSTWRRGVGDRGVLKPGEYSVDTEQVPLWSYPQCA
jgi:hypothetical protein